MYIFEVFVSYPDRDIPDTFFLVRIIAQPFFIAYPKKIPVTFGKTIDGVASQCTVGSGQRLRTTVGNALINLVIIDFQDAVSLCAYPESTVFIKIKGTYGAFYLLAVIAEHR